MNKLFIDIEVSPNIGMFWQPGNKISIPYENIIKERAIICVCWKWAGSREVPYLTWDKKQDDKKLLKELSKEWSKADVVIGHNSDKFDIKWLKSRVLRHGLEPLSVVPTIDTLKIARNNFYLNSNRLDYIGKFLNLGEKQETGGMKLWRDITLDNCPVAMEKMVKYCQQDVRLLERIYNEFAPHTPAKVPAKPLDKDRDTCPSCGTKGNLKHGIYHTKTGMYQKYRCKVCFHNWRDTRQLKL